jgi:cobalt-precorrin-5B (C1)-methyltransferase
LILKYIRPDILDGTGCSTVEELSVSKKFSALLTETLLEFRNNHPEVHVIIIDRNGKIVGESP